MISEKQLKIAMLSTHSCPLGKLGAKDTGGMSVYIVELARELGKRGHQVDVYTRVHDPRDEQITGLGNNARLIHLRAGKIGFVDKLAVYPLLPDFVRELESFRRQNDIHYDLIHSHYWLSGWAGRLLQKQWQVPHITMFHTVGAIKNALGIGDREPELRLRTEQNIMQNAQRIIVATEREKRDLSSHCNAAPERISVIPCGVNMDLFRPMDRELARQESGMSSAEKHILFVGRIEPLKGVDRLLTALAYLKDKLPVKLWIIGGDARSQQEVERLKVLARELGVQASVAFLGLVKQAELPHYYSAADVCVIPSYYESFGLVLLESLACGTPVVATDVGAAKSIVRAGKTGYVVPDNSPRRLAQRLMQILAKPPASTESRNAMRASVARYSWAYVAAMVESEYYSALAEYASCPLVSFQCSVEG